MSAKGKEGSPSREKPSFQERFFEYLDKETKNQTKFAVHQEIVKLLGKLEPGVFLSQIIYWSDRSTKRTSGFYKSDKDWAVELHMTRYSIREARKLLEDADIIKTEIHRANGAPTLHYHLNEEMLKNAIVRFQTNGIPISDKRWSENGQTLTDTISNITHKDYHDKGLFQTTRPISFQNFIKKNHVDKMKKETIEYFLTNYKECRRNEHPNLKRDQWQRVIDDWWQAGIFPLEDFQVNEIIPAYFEKAYQEGCDYSILHFISGKIRENLVYENCYYGTGEVEEE